MREYLDVNPKGKKDTITNKAIFDLFTDPVVKETPKELHKIKREHAKMQRGETKQKRREIVNEKNLQLLGDVYDFLELEFKDSRTITGKEGPNNTKEFIVDYQGKKNYYPEMQINIDSNNKIEMIVYPDWHYDADFYVAKDLTLDEMIDKVKKTKELLALRTFKESGLLTKESHKVKIDEFRGSSKTRIGYPTLF